MLNLLQHLGSLRLIFWQGPRAATFQTINNSYYSWKNSAVAIGETLLRLFSSHPLNVLPCNKTGLNWVHWVFTLSLSHIRLRSRTVSISIRSAASRADIIGLTVTLLVVGSCRGLGCLLQFRESLPIIGRSRNYVTIKFWCWWAEKVWNGTLSLSCMQPQLLKGNSGIFKPYFWHEIRSSTHREQFGESRRPSEDI